MAENSSPELALKAVDQVSFAVKGAKPFIHDSGRFAYLDSGGPGGAIFELMQRPR